MLPDIRLQPSTLYNYFASREDVEKSEDTYDTLGQPYYLEPKNSNYIITAPAGDNDNNPSLTKPASIQDVLEKAKNKLDEGKTILIPICQQNKYLFFGSRDHFTLLEVSKNENGQIQARHYDSKGTLGRLYSLESILEALRNVFGLNKVTMERSYTGHQKLLDDVNCGRFVMGYIDQKLSGEQLLSDPTTKFVTINEKLNELNTDLRPEDIKINSHDVDGFEAIDDVMDEQPKRSSDKDDDFDLMKKPVAKHKSQKEDISDDFFEQRREKGNHYKRELADEFVEITHKDLAKDAKSPTKHRDKAQKKKESQSKDDSFEIL